MAKTRGYRRNALRFVEPLLVLVLAAVAFDLVAVQPAWAYVDPSVMTYTIQALAGVAVALGAVAGVAWRRIRGFVYRALEIDPNRGKNAEADVHRVRPSEAPRRPRRPKRMGRTGKAAKDAAASPEGGSAQRKRPRRPLEAPPLRVRFVSVLLAALFAVSSVFLFPALEIVASAGGDIAFGPFDVLAPLLAATLAVSEVVALALCIPKRGHTVILSVLVAVGVCAFLQAGLLNVSLPIADGSQVDWSSYLPISIVSVVVWAAVAVLFVLVSVRRELLAKLICIVAGIFLFATQAVSVGLALPTDSGAGGGSGDVQVTQEGLYTVSSKSNTIVFVLDSFDNSVCTAALAADPSLATTLSGFTHYTDSAGSFEHTRYSLPYLLTGRTPMDSASQTWWEDGTEMLEGVVQRGYSVGLYSTSLYDGSYAFEDLALNIHSANVYVSWDGTVSTLGRCAFYRCLPWPLKPAFAFYTDDLNAGVVDTSREDEGESPYVMDDYAYYTALSASGLSADDDSATGAFRLIHLNGTHAPYTLTQDLAYDENSATELSSAIASLKIVGEYVSELKRLGVYDQTCIVVTADHGNRYEIDCGEEPVRALNPLMLVKPANTGAASSSALAVSDIRTGHVDFPATIVDATGGDASEWSGTPIYNLTSNYRTRYFIHTVNADGENTANRDVLWVEYAINGTADNLANWSKTGRTWTPVLPD